MGGDPDTPVIEPDGVHPLLDAVARAFAGHRWLVLSPDAVWLTIAQGLAQHLRLHAEKLRPELVAHADREALVREVLAMPKGTDGWRELVKEFGKEVAARANGADLFGRRTGPRPARCVRPWPCRRTVVSESSWWLAVS